MPWVQIQQPSATNSHNASMGAFQLKRTCRPKLVTLSPRTPSPEHLLPALEELARVAAYSSISLGALPWNSEKDGLQYGEQGYTCVPDILPGSVEYTPPMKNVPVECQQLFTWPSSKRPESPKTPPPPEGLPGLAMRVDKLKLVAPATCQAVRDPHRPQGVTEKIKLQQRTLILQQKRRGSKRKSHPSPHLFECCASEKKCEHEAVDASKRCKLSRRELTFTVIEEPSPPTTPPPPKGVRLLELDALLPDDKVIDFQVK